MHLMIDAQTCKTVVAHNVHFDLSVVFSEMFRWVWVRS
jgi:hypothetical protein